MQSFWVDFPLTANQYAGLELKWRRRQNRYDVCNPHPDLRIRSFCTFGGDDFQVLSAEFRGDVDHYFTVLKEMDTWINETLGTS